MSSLSTCSCCLVRVHDIKCYLSLSQAGQMLCVIHYGVSGRVLLFRGPEVHQHQTGTNCLSGVLTSRTSDIDDGVNHDKELLTFGMYCG